MSLDAKTAIGATRDLPLLRPGRLWQCVVSPDGTRLAWVAQRLDGEGQEGDLYDVWLSDLDGSILDDLGSVPGTWARFPREPGRDHYRWPQDLAWMPGGVGLSFLYRDVLWTVPAEAAR